MVVERMTALVVVVVVVRQEVVRHAVETPVTHGMPK